MAGIARPPQEIFRCDHQKFTPNAQIGHGPYAFCKSLVISENHDGQTEASNLAYACAFCNRAKGSDVGSIVQRTGAFVRFFNPRIDCWAEHFVLDCARIVALSDIGEVTIRILDINNEERLFERQTLHSPFAHFENNF
jgi:hypothetical protein